MIIKAFVFFCFRFKQKKKIQQKCQNIVPRTPPQPFVWWNSLAPLKTKHHIAFCHLGESSTTRNCPGRYFSVSVADEHSRCL